MTRFLTTFATVFLADLGDKAQLQTRLFAADADKSRITVFFAVAAARIASTGLAGLLGMAAEKWLTPLPAYGIPGISLSPLVPGHYTDTSPHKDTPGGV